MRPAHHLGDPDLGQLTVVTTLQDNLSLRERELKIAHEELSFTSQLVDKMRMDLTKTDEINAKLKLDCKQAKREKVLLEVEMDALKEQLRAKDSIIGELRNAHKSAITDRDKHLLKLQQLHADIEIEADNASLADKRRKVTTKAMQEVQDNLQQQYAMVQKRLKSAEYAIMHQNKENAKLQITIRELEENLEEQASQLRSEQRENSDLRILQTEMQNSMKELESKVTHSKGLLKTADTDAMKRARVAEQRIGDLSKMIERLKIELGEALNKHGEKDNRIAELEDHLDMQIRGKIISSAQDAPDHKSLKQQNLALQAELESVKQHLESREIQNSDLKNRLEEAEKEVRNRRDSIARRASVAAQGEANLSVQLSQMNARVQVLERENTDLVADHKVTKRQLQEMTLKLKHQRAVNLSRKEKYEMAEASLHSMKSQIHALREDVVAKGNLAAEYEAQKVQLDADIEILETEASKFKLQARRERTQYENAVIRSESRLQQTKQLLSESEQREADLRGKLAEARSKSHIERLASENLASELEGAAAQKSKLEAEILRASEHLSRRESSLKNLLEQERSEKQDVQQKCQELEEEMRMLRSQVQNLRAEGEYMSSKLESQGEMLMQQRSELAKANSKNNRNSVPTAVQKSVDMRAHPQNLGNYRTVLPPQGVSGSSSSVFSNASLSAEKGYSLELNSAMPLQSTDSIQSPLGDAGFRHNKGLSTYKELHHPDAVAELLEQAVDENLSGGDLSSIASEDAWLIITLEIGEGVSHDIEVRYGDDPQVSFFLLFSLVSALDSYAFAGIDMRCCEFTSDVKLFPSFFFITFTYCHSGTCKEVWLRAWFGQFQYP